MNAEGLINVSQAVTHGNLRQVRNLKSNKQGSVINVEGNALTVLVDQTSEVWACEDCEEINTDWLSPYIYSYHRYFLITTSCDWKDNRVFLNFDGFLCVRCQWITFFFVTTSEKKNGFLLIETYKTTKWWPPGSTLGGHLLFIRVSKNFAFQPIWGPRNNVGG